MYLSLSVVLDLFGRFVVAWMVSVRENSALANSWMKPQSDTVSSLVSSRCIRIAGHR